MAKRRKMVVKGNYYYCYISLWNKDSKTTKQIPIKLAHKDEFKKAEYRKGIVERKAFEFKLEGKLHLIKEYQWEWATESKVAEWKKPLSLQEGIDKYLQKVNRLRRSSTIAMMENSLEHWTRHLGSSKVVEEITTKDLTAFVVRFKKDDDNPEEIGKHSDTTINMNLRNLRTLLIFLNDEGEIQLNMSNVKFKNALKECPINDTEPIYISEVEFNQIMSEEWCLLHSSKREWYREIFQLYWDLGIRLSEGFKGVIQGNYLHITEEVAKNSLARDVRINSSQRATIEKLQAMYFESGMSNDHINNYSKVFKKALRHCKIDEEKHFHSLRHSYGIRRRIETNGNIHQVQIEMGHKSIDSTMKYLRFDPKKLRDEFPTYRKVLDMLKNGYLNTNSTTIYSTNSVDKQVVDRRQMN